MKRREFITLLGGAAAWWNTNRRVARCLKPRPARSSYRDLLGGLLPILAPGAKKIFVEYDPTGNFDSRT
jgi:hypothetical protein